ncbi:Alpha-L-fucosidase [Lachnellula occidentalis]|uniref:Alpha-L-fucosidase n=1 Tax=Lachnellula occidentalis TaxID=215460 RepID=A0A8H8RWZ5_9HELO|nr:Alpha-L-fucosidase [Lachnellula occidentalis]
MFIWSIASAALLVTSAVAVVSNSSCGTQSLSVYPLPDGVPSKDSFSVKIRSGNGNGTWEPLGTYLATLSEIDTTSGGFGSKQSSMAYFDFCGSVVFPSLQSIGRFIQANTLTSTLTQPRNLVIQIDDDIFDVPHLFSNTIDTNAPPLDDPSVIYYGPGIHNVSGGTLSIASGQTVYIAGGGVLTSSVLFQNVTGATLRGRGLLYNTPTASVTVAYSSYITVEGVTSLNPQGAALVAGEAKDLSVSHLRSFSAQGWSDGIDLFCCQDTVIDSVFMRNFDDCIAIYQHRDDWYGNSSNITIKDSSLWADVAHPIVMGTHGNTDDPETMDSILITNLDILDHREFQTLYQGVIAINPGDNNFAQNVHIEDIRVEDFRLGRLLDLRVAFNPAYNTAPGRGIENVTIRNLNYNGTHAYLSLMAGYDEERLIKGVTFENLTINGKHIADTMQKPAWYLTSDYVPMFVRQMDSCYTLANGCVEFFCDFLVEEDGYMFANPSLSPENVYRLPNGEEGCMCIGPIMDSEILHSLFGDFLAAAEILCKTEDAALRNHVMTLRSQFPPLRIGRHGQLQEWLEDYEEAEPGHRHISHLWGLYPGSQITPKNPLLIAACKKALARRAAHGGGHTGWSRAWMIALWARLGDGDEAGMHVREILRTSTHDSLLDDHPPFQIDGDFGATAGITEMLVQSHDGDIVLLPALPCSWSEGSIKGICTRGGFVLDMIWSEGTLSSAVLESRLGNVCVLKAMQAFRVESRGGSICGPIPANVAVEFQTEKGFKYSVVVSATVAT